MHISGVLKGNEGRAQDIACQKLKPHSPSSKLIHNPMIKIKSFLNPLSVIDLIEVTENKLGRDRKNALKKGPRIIDIDLIIFDSLKIASKRLTLPHPSLGSRAYVLKLMEDIDG